MEECVSSAFSPRLPFTIDVLHLADWANGVVNATNDGRNSVVIIRVNGMDMAFRAGNLAMFAQLAAQDGVSELMFHMDNVYPVLSFVSEYDGVGAALGIKDHSFDERRDFVYELSEAETENESESDAEFSVGEESRTEYSDEAKQLANDAVVELLHGVPGARVELRSNEEMEQMFGEEGESDAELMAREEAKRRVDEINNLEAIETDNEARTKDELSEIYKSLGGVNKNGAEIQFYNSAFSKVYKNGGLFGRVIPKLKEILSNSVLEYSEQDNQGGKTRPDGTKHKSHPNIKSFHNYVGKVVIDGKEYFVRTTVQEGYDGVSGTHSYFVTEVSLYENTAIDNQTTPITARANDTNSGILDAKLKNFFDYANGLAEKPAEFAIGDKKRFRSGKYIEFTRKNPTVTFNAVMKYLDKLGIKYDAHRARTKSSYLTVYMSDYNTVEIRFANHTKADWTPFSESGIDVDLYEGNEEESGSYTIKLDLSLPKLEDVGVEDLKEFFEDLRNGTMNSRIMYEVALEESGLRYRFKDLVLEYKTEHPQLGSFTASNGVVFPDVFYKGKYIIPEDWKELPKNDQDYRWRVANRERSREEIHRRASFEYSEENWDKKAKEYAREMISDKEDEFVKEGFERIAKIIRESKTDGQSDNSSNEQGNQQNTEQTNLMRKPNGVVYGAAKGRTIYLNREHLNANTGVHEYTHLWANAMMRKNPKGWSRIKDLLRGTPVWDEVLNDENYADIRGNEDAVASEVLSRLSGRNGAERLERMAERLLAEADGVFEKAEAHSLIERIRSAIEQFWNWVGKDLFGITDFGSIEEVQDRVLYDLVKGTDLGLSELTEADGSSEYQIIGEQGASALDRAEEATVRMDNLRVAREMERAGKDAKTVRLATGWERGADGKWRYEIEDIELIPFKEKYNQLMTLSEYVKADGLFKAYPKLRDVGVETVSNLPNSILASFDKTRNRIEINNQANENEIREIIAHEIQHAIQEIEGFARGGNSAQFGEFFGDVNIGELKGMAEFAVTIPTDITRDELIAKYKTEEDKLKRYVYVEILGGIADGEYSVKDVIDLIVHDYEVVVEKFKKELFDKDSSYNKYLRLAGEVESRNVQLRRLGMTPEQRRETLLAETEDIAREDQIFLMDNAGVAKMAYPYKYDTVEYDKENGTQLTRFIEYLRRGKTLLEGESRFFPIAKAGEILNNYGIIGMITPSTATFNRRHSKEHNLTEKEWKKIAVAINNPLYITQTENHRENDFRVYTPIQRGHEVILVALKIKQQGQNLFVADVRTAFPREISKIKSNEENVLYDRKKEKQRILKESSSGQSQRYISDESVAYSGKDTQFRENKQETSEKSGSSLSARTVSAMDGHVRGVAERLGLSNVDVVADGSGFEGRRGKAKGFFDKTTGRITIVLGNHSSVADVERTLLHEAVAHYGLRRLFGDRFDAFLDGVFENVDRSTREAIVALAGRHGWDFRTATEEYLASIAEDMNFERYDVGIFLARFVAKKKKKAIFCMFIPCK